MARRVFFSFHHERDSGRIGQIRNIDIMPSKSVESPFVDAATWEKVKQQGDQVIKQWIEKNLKGTSVTVVLIGAETASRKWVLHEIESSWDLRKGLLGIWIHNIQCVRTRVIDTQGQNPFDRFLVMNPDSGKQVLMSNYIKTYDWIRDNGVDNIKNWIEEAGEFAKR